MVLMNASGMPMTPNQNPHHPAAPSKEAGTQPNSAYIVDASEADFMVEVIEASQQQPVLVDFWAPWCEPCKQFTPILEKAIEAEKGRVKLVKVNIDENQNIAAQLQIRSLPTTMIFVQGRPVESIPGVLPADTIRKLLADLLKMMGSGSTAEEFQQLVAQAEEALGNQEFDLALQHFETALAIDSADTVVISGLIRAYIGLNQPETAQELYDALDPEVQNQEMVQNALQGLQLLGSGDEGAVTEAKAQLDGNPEKLELHFQLAEAYLEANRKEEAVESLLHILATDRTWNDKAAHEKLLEIFAALGFQDPLAKSGRQRMSAILFA